MENLECTDNTVHSYFMERTFEKAFWRIFALR